jgi:trans-feruloyl-CoA hydratase/vanillin synthase
MKAAHMSEPSERQLIRVENDDGIVTLTIDRPEKRNAMNPLMHQQLRAALNDLRFDPATRVLIVTGTGESFCAGQDLKEMFFEMEAQQAIVARKNVRAIAQEWNQTLRLFPAPTIAAVNGWCFGGAFQLVCACDIAIAADEAIFGLSEINFRGLPGGLVTKYISETLMPRQGLYYALTGKTFDGKRAAEIGLVTLSVPKERLMAEVREHAELLRAKDALALQATKELYKINMRMDWEESYNFSMAKANQMNYLQAQSQGSNGESAGIADFVHGKYKPGLEHVQKSGS